MRQRLLGVQARRRPRGVDARRPVGRAALEHLARQSLQRAAAGAPRPRDGRGRQARRRQGHSASRVVPADTPWVKRFKIQSPMLTKFWGRPIYLGATVLLPRDYDRETMSYPVLYDQGHFSTGAPLGFDPDFTPTDRAVRTTSRCDWVKPDFPKMVVVTFQHPTPYFDDSYAVNSVNVGPYGDAIMQELIPEVEKRFRVMREPYARVLSGGSTGGWESLALQIFHPDFFGGTWSSCPDSVTFTDVEGHQHLQGHERVLQVERQRLAEGADHQQPRGERAGAPDLRAAQPLRARAVERRAGRASSSTSGRPSTGRSAPDGYFQPLFNKRTGEIDPKVAQYWKEHYDLLALPAAELGDGRDRRSWTRSTSTPARPTPTSSTTPRASCRTG